jgi:hypothetical protein
MMKKSRWKVTFADRIQKMSLEGLQEMLHPLPPYHYDADLIFSPEEKKFIVYEIARRGQIVENLKRYDYVDLQTFPDAKLVELEKTVTNGIQLAQIRSELKHRQDELQIEERWSQLQLVRKDE